MRYSWISILALVSSGSLHAAEKWADAKFPLPDVPALWLDASRQPAAYQAHARSLASASAMDVWYDASGNSNHLSQRTQAMQPHYFEAGGVGLVRFQGKEHLGRTGSLAGLKSFSLFLVSVPRSNKGGFQGWFATSELGKNDYVTGMTVDQHFGASALLSQINVEGRGFGGAVNLMKDSLPFGRLHLLRVDGGQDKITLAIDGKVQGSRPRKDTTISLDTLTLGARYYSNSGDPPFIQGFFNGDIAEVLLFRRALKPEETSAIESYLKSKYTRLNKELVAGSAKLGHFLRPVADPPPVQMFLPGFTVREIPVRLPNINNVQYRHDGKLVALGYNGNVYLLSDTDGDGLEDKAQLFWENKTGLRGPIGILLTPKGYKKGQGLFVASKGKVSLIVDTDGDDKADKEIIVAQGWKEIPQAVDALGVAMDKAGNVYFGLGCADFANAYQKQGGKAHFDINSDRGTIQKVSPDFKKRETVCTGIRFPVGLSFNRHGDLFCTDQEGATWLPNGNPFDELLHIQPGRHYGFPPRHPKHLPDVIDEPSVFDYGPQHQSTCGLFFNESVNGGPVFGPKEWAGDALICGESRGKLFRTKLVKTPTGYVAQSHLLACLQMLTIDACVSPQGDLVVCCHSGPPDWGTGPQGMGKLYKISFTGKKVPQPLFAYAAGPREVRIPFDRPLDPNYLKAIAKQVKIEYGQYVRPGDRFETLQPPYAVVKMQLATPRYDLPVHSVQVTGDRRTLVLTTGPHVQPVSYAVTLPGFGPAKKYNTIDLGYDLTGIHAEWIGKDGQKWSGWLPHLELDVSKELTAGSAEHEPFWKMIQKPGKYIVKMNLDLFDMLRPAVQPGAQLDSTLPPEEVRLTLEMPDKQGDCTYGGTSSSGTINPGKGYWYTIKTQVDKDMDSPIMWTTLADKGLSFFRAHFDTNEDRGRPRSLPLRRIFQPWVERKPQKVTVVANRDLPQLKGGNWARGHALFHSDKVLCGKCHQVQGKGGLIGPDLSNLVHRDYDSVLRDIRFPSAALNPDYLAYRVNLKDGRSLLGTLRGEADKLWVGDSEGKEVAIAKNEIDKLISMPQSIMPEGLDKKLSAEEMRDLLTFLLTEPLQPAPLQRKDAPPPRKKAEVDKILKGVKRPDGPLKKVHIVLAAGPKDHGPDEHDYPLWQRRWLDLLLTAPEVKVSTVMGWPNAKQWESADLVVFYSANPAWAPPKAKELDAFLERGGGLVFIHWAVEGRKDADLLAERIGLASNASRLKFRHGPLEIAFPPKHPITKGFDKVRFIDESYWNMVGDPGKVKLLGTSMEDGQPRPQLWTYEKGRGRVFVNILGHYTWTFDDPLYRILLLRGMAWASRQPVERWIDLATIGVRIEE